MPMPRWANLEEVPLNPLITGRVVEVPKAMLVRIKAPKGPINMHSHDLDQISHMLAGIAALSERHRGKSANDLMREAIFTPLADLNR